MAKLKLWLDEKLPKVAPDTLTRKAIKYLINQWVHIPAIVNTYSG